MRALALLLVALAGCESCGTDGVHHLPDCRDDAIAALVAELDKRF